MRPRPAPAGAAVRRLDRQVAVAVAFVVTLLGGLAVNPLAMSPAAATVSPAATTPAATTPPASTPPATTPPTGETIVSLTFDDGFKGQQAAARVLAAHDMAGTFYVISGYIGFPAYLTLEQLRNIARLRNEIGGHTTVHDTLTEISPEKARREICNDRATLSTLGFQVTSFAYPSGADSPAVARLVQDCGYNSARDVSGLFDGPTVCGDCPVGEDVPPANEFRIRTNDDATTVPLLEQRVLAAENGGGGWVPLVFHHICTCPDKGDEAITLDDFRAFIAWLAARPDTTSVQTVDQVVGGPYKRVVGTPLARLVGGGGDGGDAGRGALSKLPAVTVLGYDIGQSQLIFTGLLLTAAVVVTYRAASRGQRYGR